VIVVHVLEPFASGVTTAVASITGELPDFTHVVIHGSRNWVEHAEEVKKRFPPGVQFIEWKSAAREISLYRDWKALWELIAILKNYPHAVVHLHSSKAGFLGRLACRILGIKAVIYTPHCGAFLRKDVGFFKRKLYWFFEWIGGSFGGRVVGCGPSEGELYRKLGKNATFVSNGIQLKKQIHGGPRNLISFSGIASFQKDPVLWNSVAAAYAGTAELSGFSFCWIGSGPLEEGLNRELVTVTGWQDAKRVDELLEKTAVYFSASAWEGLPYGVLEAMNCGCALLLRNVPGNRELVSNGENGWLFDSPEEAISRLKTMMEDPPALSVMGRRSREILEQGYTVKQMGEGYRSIYLAAFGGGKP
jgi:glycosyltransferase involved in cell wall biosynthesis